MSNPMERDEDAMRRFLDEDEHDDCEKTIRRLLRKIDKMSEEIVKLKKQLKNERFNKHIN